MTADNIISIIIEIMAGCSGVMLLLSIHMIKRIDELKYHCDFVARNNNGLLQIINGYRKDCKWYVHNLNFIRMAAKDPNGTLEEIHQLADDALKHEGREDEKTTT
jgi:hypothetical protein